MKDYVVAIAAMWENIGLSTEIREMEFSAVAAGIPGGDHQLLHLSLPGIRRAAAPDDSLRLQPGTLHALLRERHRVGEHLQRAELAQLSRSNWATGTPCLTSLFYEVASIPLHTLSVQVVIDPEVVEEYIYLGPYGGQFTDLEHIKGVRY